MARNLKQEIESLRHKIYISCYIGDGLSNHGMWLLSLLDCIESDRVIHFDAKDFGLQWVQEIYDLYIEKILE